MAKVSFETAQQYEESRPSGGSGGLFEFFNLKNDGDSAVVRFLYNDVSEFDIFTCHNVTINGKYRKVSCIREPHDSTEACPLCASGNNISNRFFIKMLEYRMNAANGQMEVHPVVWERSMSYASRLKSMLDEYGPLKDSLFKVKRNGAAGSMDTTYDILFCSPKVYSDASYPMIPNAFEGVNILGTLVLNKSYQDIETFMATGAFPQGSTNQQQAATVTPPQYTPKTKVDIQVDTTPAIVTQQPYVAPQVPDIPQPPVGVTPPVVTNVPQQPVPTGMGVPSSAPAQPAMQRPVRYY